MKMYNIKIVHYDFDSENDNVMLYSTKADMRSALLSLSGMGNDNINFDVNNLIKTDVVFNNLDQPLMSLLNYNYCIVYNDDEIYCYFIREMKQLSGRQVMLSLEIDSWNTYIYDISAIAYVRRSMPDRFKPVISQQGNVLGFAYDNTLTSPLYQREAIRECPKYVDTKCKLDVVYNNDVDNDNVATWMRSNIDHWEYLYVDVGEYVAVNTSVPDTPQELKFNIGELRYMTQEEGAGGAIRSGIGVLVQPVYKSSKNLKYKNANGDIIDFGSFSKFKDQNGLAKVHANKHSIVPPFRMDSTITGTIDTNGDLIIDWECINRNMNASLYNVWVTEQYITKPIALSIRKGQSTGITSYYDKDIVTSTAQGNFEPKILNEDYSVYRIYCGGQSYDLPILKTSNRPQFLYTEALTPDITKGYLRYDDVHSPHPYTARRVFGADNTKDLTGLIVAQDFSMWLVKEQLDTWLAQNKNNLQIFQNKIEQRDVGAMVGLTASTLGMLAGGDASIGMGTIASGVRTSLDKLYDQANYNLTIDNMRQAPDQLGAVNSNIVMQNGIDEFGIYLEVLKLLPKDEKVVRNYLYLNGYVDGEVRDLSTIMRTRRYFNYVQADIIELTANMSEEQKDRMRAIFSRGVRIWHDDYYVGVKNNLNNIERSVLAYGN